MSPFCAQAGLYLASGPFSSNIRHFGLQLMEHTVKFKWNCISQQEKIFIKVGSSDQDVLNANKLKLISGGQFVFRRARLIAAYSITLCAEYPLSIYLPITCCVDPVCKSYGWPNQIALKHSWQPDFFFSFIPNLSSPTHTRDLPNWWDIRLTPIQCDEPGV